MEPEEPIASELIYFDETPMEMSTSEIVPVASPMEELSPINSELISEPISLIPERIGSNEEINIDETDLETTERTPSMIARGPSKLATRMISKESLNHVRRMIASRGKKSVSYDLCRLLDESTGQGLPAAKVVKPQNRMRKFLEVRPTKTSRMRSKKPVEDKNQNTISTSDKKPIKATEVKPRKVSRIMPLEVKPTRTSKLRAKPSEIKVEEPSKVKQTKEVRKSPPKEVKPTKTSKMRSTKPSDKPERPEKPLKIKPPKLEVLEMEETQSSEKEEKPELPNPQISETDAEPEAEAATDADRMEQEEAPPQEEAEEQNLEKALPRIRVKPSERISSQTLCSLTRGSRLSANPSSSCRGISVIGLSLIANDLGDLARLEKSVAKLGEEVLAMEMKSKDIEKAAGKVEKVEKVPKKKATKPIVVRQTKATLARVNRFKDPPAEPAPNDKAPIAPKSGKKNMDKPRITLIDRLNMALQAKKDKEAEKDLQTARSNRSDKPVVVRKTGKSKQQTRLGKKASGSLLQSRSRTFPVIIRSQVSDFRRGGTALARSIGTQAGLRASPSGTSSIQSAPATPRGRKASKIKTGDPSRQPATKGGLTDAGRGTWRKTTKRTKRNGKKSTLQKKSKRQPKEMEPLMMVKIYEAPKRQNRFGCTVMTSADYVPIPRTTRRRAFYDSDKEISLISDPFQESDSLSSMSSVSKSEVGDIAIDMLRRQACQLRIYDDLDDDRVANPDEELGHGHLFGPLGGVPGLPDNVRAMGQALEGERDAYHQKLMLVDQSINVMPVIEVTRLDTILCELEEERKLDEAAATAARVALPSETMDDPGYTPEVEHLSPLSAQPTAEDGCDLDDDDDAIELTTPRPLMPVIPPSRAYSPSERSDSSSINIRITTKKPKDSEFYEFPTNVDDFPQNDDNFSDFMNDDDRKFKDIGNEDIHGKDLSIKGDSDSGDKYHDFIMNGDKDLGDEGSRFSNKDDSDDDRDLQETGTGAFSMHSIP
ncbi:uncharacterized protein Dana_GF19564, isoform B [Drosophila ananassae]|uniref:Uncharacterized protein, isoform A n=1 Tax=Drosophila ananassae TaxID=7217 RepID=B3MY25_DROAN|nr:uncharacterized protein LOC6502320 [Drosophila ananassae]XP_014760014.1 uncharacterized protein LOC6502320 [Drosophila ananassae]EDV38640.1 uncharacterized protein Dana_GF19564, isoform A [Drosophila ananassae]KPU77502.1 uncharacterized protein Dana_GF19564, isoform B [Drosophila ananassae]